MKVQKLSFLFPSVSIFDVVKGTIKREENKMKVKKLLLKKQPRQLGQLPSERNFDKLREIFRSRKNMLFYVVSVVF